MRFSDLLRWGAAKESNGVSSDASRESGSFWNIGRTKEEPPLDTPKGPARLDWMEGTGSRHRARTVLHAADRGAVTAKVHSAPAVGAAVWITSGGARPRPGVVRSCEPSENGYQVSLTFNCAIQRNQGSGAARLEWVDGQGKLISTPAGICNSEVEGMVQATAAQAVPAGALVLVVGAKVCCLSEVRRCDSAGDAHAVELEAVAEACDISAAA